MPEFQKFFTDADRKQALSDALMQRAFQSRAPQQQGRITPKMGLVQGLAPIAEALLSKRISKQASGLREQGDEAKREAMVAALQGLGGQDTMLASTEGGAAPANPYQSAQQAIDAGVDPSIVGTFLKVRQGPAVDPSSVREWEFYSQLPPEDQSRYLEMKRALQIKDVRGAPSIIESTGVTPLSTPEEETKVAADRAQAVAEAEAGVTSAKDRTAAELKLPRLEAAERRLERVDAAVKELADNRILTGGPMQGAVLGFTEEGQELEQSNAQLLAELTALTRIPGVGQQSDLEQRLQQLVLPSPNMYPDVNKKAVEELHLFIGDLGNALRGVGGDSQPVNDDPLSGLSPELRKKYGLD